MIAQVIDLTSSVANIAAPSSGPNTLVDTLLADLEKAISTLPSNHPDPTDTEELAIFPQALPTSIDRDNAWESILDPCLNRFLGFGRSIESITASLKGQKKALVSMARFL